MNKRAISPLIATFILISLTVAVGAMIVAWGRNYVQKQMVCIRLGARMSVVSKDFTSVPAIINISVMNTGEVALRPEDLYFRLAAADKVENCFRAVGSCYFEIENNEQISPGEIKKIKLSIDKQAINTNFISSIELYHKPCDQLVAITTI